MHERICQHNVAAGAVVKLEGKPYDLLERLATDEAFAGVDLQAAMEPRQFVGRPSEQVDEFVQTIVAPLRRRYPSAADLSSDVNV